VIEHLTAERERREREREKKGKRYARVAFE
jgi:hypothetical protein